MDIIEAGILGFLVGISGTVLGGILIFRLGTGLARQSWLLGVSGGIMVAVVVFDLWVEALRYGSLLTAGLGTLAGALIINHFELYAKVLPKLKRYSLNKVIKVGILLGLGIGIHNFPEGVALGTTFIANRTVTHWIGLAGIMAAHNIPEGMVMSAAFQLGKVRFRKILLALILVELPMALGSVIGALLGKISGLMISFSLAFAGGAMIFLVGKELLPLAKRIGGLFPVGSGFITGFLIGMVLVSLI